MQYCTDKLRNRQITKLQNSSRGYILITLMLFMTLLTMAALAILPEITQQIQRDREEEMIHRGTEYMRAIKKYYKKFGRYPSRIEELENTNQQRFLRKHYKDPLSTDAQSKSDKDFKLIHPGDPVLNMLGLGGAGLGQAGLPGQGGLPGQQGLLGQQGPGQTSLPGGKQMPQIIQGGAGG